MKTIVKIIDDKIEINRNGTLIYKRVDELLFCEGIKRYTHFYFCDKTIVKTAKNLGSFEKLLPASHFERCHKSFIINKTLLLTAVIQEHRILYYDYEIPISKRKYIEIKDCISRF